MISLSSIHEAVHQNLEIPAAFPAANEDQLELERNASHFAKY